MGIWDHGCFTRPAILHPVLKKHGFDVFILEKGNGLGLSISFNPHPQEEFTVTEILHGEPLIDEFLKAVGVSTHDAKVVHVNVHTANPVRISTNEHAGVGD